MKLAELNSQVKTQNDEVKAFFDGLGDREPTADEVKHIKDLNKQIEENEHKLAELQEVEGLKSGALKRYERLQTPANGIPFPGAGLPESSGDAAAQQSYKSLGQQFVDDPAVKEWMGRIAPDGRVPDRVSVQSPHVQIKSMLEAKTLVTGLDSAQGGAFVINDRRPIVDAGTFQRPLRIRDLVTVLQTTSDTIEYVRTSSSPTNAAAPVAEATASTGASGTKPESAIAFSIVTETIKTIAHWMPVTRRALADASQVRGIIDQFLRYGIDEEIEDQMMTGNGVGENFTGIDNTAGTNAQAFDTNLLTTLRKARTKVQLNGRANPSAYVMHPLDWQAVDLLQDNEARYFFGGPSAIQTPRIWGLPVVESEGCPQGRGFVGDWKYAVLWDRQQTNILVSDSHSDWFIRNIIAILAEARAGFGIIRPSAFTEIAFS